MANEILGPPVLEKLKPLIGREEISLDEGQAILTMPLELSTGSLEDFEYWVAGIIKKARRRAEKSASVNSLD